MADPIKDVVIFDAGKGYGSVADLLTFVDCTVVKRENRWWMYACGITKTYPEITLYSASLPEGAPLSAAGWEIATSSENPQTPVILAGKNASHWWDGQGGRHCPSYIKGWDNEKQTWVERIYYAGAAHNLMGPYAIGYVEWDGEKWIDQPAPVFTANEYWEHGSVYEPNLVYHDGKWKMWYVAGANQDDYLVQGYAESPNGRTDWSKHEIVFAPEEKVFDFCVIPVNDGYEAVFSRVNVSGAVDAPHVGLWWCRGKDPSAKISDWSRPVRISPPGPWKPVVRYDDTNPAEMFIFYDGAYPNTAGTGIPVHFTVHCMQIRRPV